MARRPTGRPPALTDAQMLELVATLDREPYNHAEAARRFGVHRATVRWHRRRLRALGWGCPLFWAACTVCGGMVAGAAANQTAHPACAAERDRRYRLAARRERLAAGYDEAAVRREWTARNPEKAETYRRNKRPIERDRRRERRDALPEADRLAEIDALHARTAALQEQTRQHDRNRREPWTAEEDARLLAWRTRHPPQHELALALGRSLSAVRNRFHELRKRGLRPVGDE